MSCWRVYSLLCLSYSAKEMRSTGDQRGVATSSQLDDEEDPEKEKEEKEEGLSLSEVLVKSFFISEVWRVSIFRKNKFLSVKSNFYL